VNAIKNSNSFLNLFKTAENKNRTDWQLFLIKVYQKLKENDILIQAMAMVYMTLLSIIPFLLFLFYIMTLFNFFGRLDSIIAELQAFILNNLAAGTGESLLNYLEGFIYNVDIEQLGILSFTSLIVVVVIMLARIEKTFNKIWSVKEHRDILKRFVSFWTVLTLGTFLTAVLLTLALFFSDKLLGTIFSASLPEKSSLLNLFLFSLNFLIFTAAYYFIPNTDVKASAALTAGIISGGLFILSRRLYSIYTGYLITYRQIYGSLAFIPIFLVWLYLVWIIILSGAVISYVFQNRKNIIITGDGSIDSKVFKVFLPTAVLLSVYKEFRNPKSNGLSRESLKEKIRLPAAYIEEVLVELKQENIIAETKENKFIPTGDISQICLAEIRKNLFFEDKVLLEKVFKEKEFKVLYEKIENSLKNSLETINLDQIIKNENLK